MVCQSLFFWQGGRLIFRSRLTHVTMFSVFINITISLTLLLPNTTAQTTLWLQHAWGEWNRQLGNRYACTNINADIQKQIKHSQHIISFDTYVYICSSSRCFYQKQLIYKEHHKQFVMRSTVTVMSKPRRLIHHGFPRDFPMGFYNGVFQCMSKTRPVVFDDVVL